MSQAKITRSNQITFLYNFVELWEKIEKFDDDNALFASVQQHMTEVLNSFYLSNGLPQVCVGEMLSELEAMPTLYNWKQLLDSGEMKDLSGITEPNCWLYDKGQNIDVWYPVVNLTTSNKTFFVKDKSRDGVYVKDADLAHLAGMGDVNNYEGEPLITWAIDAEEGDDFDNAETHVLCINVG